MRLSRQARFIELYRMRSRVAAYVRSRGAHWSTVDDVVADTYLVAWRRIELVPLEDEAALSWLCAVARLMLANGKRSWRRVVALAERVSVHVRHPMAADVSVRSLSAEAWQSLSERDRVVLHLVAWHGSDLTLLAELLGCSRAAAATALSRARARLDAALAS